MKLLLMRHGQTRYNVERRFLGRTDLQLDEEGSRQAMQLGRRYQGVGTVYSSPLRRALDTAAGLGPPHIHPGLVEMDMGLLEGLSREEMEEKYPGLLSVWFQDPTHFRPPEGETLAETQQRGWQALMDIWHQGAGECRILVTHQLVLASVLCKLAELPLSGFRKFSHGNTGVTTLQEREGMLEILQFNDLSHLSADPQ